MSAEVSTTETRSAFDRRRLADAAEKDSTLVSTREGWPPLETNEEDDGR